MEMALIAGDEIVICEDGIMDVALASRCRGAIDSNDLCGFLTDCLRDVRFTVLAKLYLFDLLLDFDFGLPS
jgi:hypothetical protein